MACLGNFPAADNTYMNHVFSFLDNEYIDWFMGMYKKNRA